MALDFPASPTVGQKYPSPAVTGVPVYSWDGEKWTTLGGAIGSTGASDAIPLQDTGTGAAGSSTLWSRGDHAHPPITTSPTPPPGDNDTSIATTAFVSNAVSTAVGGIPGAPSAVVRYDIAQTLTAPQLIQARQNIYAAPFDAMAYGGLQINGGFEVSQELGGAGRTTSGYLCDGFSLGMSTTASIAAAQATASNPFVGFPKYGLIWVTAAQASLGAGDYVIMQQFIEGYRCARLAWGTANAQPITIGFWSAHQRTGLYSGSIRNVPAVRSYVFTYTQAASFIPQYNVVTIPGDTAGTWNIDNTTGLTITWAVASGATFTAPSTNVWSAGNYIAAPGQVNAIAATSDNFRIVGVIILPGNEAPSAARSPFVMRPYDQELVTCQRHWQKIGGQLQEFYLYGYQLAGLNLTAMLRLQPEMRAAPTLSGVGTFTVGNVSTSSNVITPKMFMYTAVVAVTGQAYVYNNANSYYALDARL